jgi:hypothetical protein
MVCDRVTSRIERDHAKHVYVGRVQEVEDDRRRGDEACYRLLLELSQGCDQGMLRWGHAFLRWSILATSRRAGPAKPKAKCP